MKMDINIAIVYSGFANVEDRAFFYLPEGERELSRKLGDRRWDAATIGLPEGFTIKGEPDDPLIRDCDGCIVDAFAKIERAGTATITLQSFEPDSGYYWRKKYKVTL